jgi:hypothetical protein
MTTLLLLWLALRCEQESATAKLERKKAADKLDEVNRNLLAVQIKLTSNEEEKRRIQFEHEIAQIDQERKMIEFERKDEWHGSDRARELTERDNELMLSKSKREFEHQHVQYQLEYGKNKALQSEEL